MWKEVSFPVPRHKFMHARDGQVGQPGENIGEPGLQVDVVHFAVTIRVYMAAAR